MKTTITANVLRRGMTGAVALGLLTAAMAQPGRSRDVDVPQALEVPSGNVPFLRASAAGTQNYLCMPAGWTFIGPQATLYLWTPNDHIRKQVATHFLSQNPVEGGTARPVWQDSQDSSMVWARPMASSSDPGYVDPGAVPWLLLVATGTQGGSMGGAVFSQTTYIHRVNTTGGLSPTTVCNVGERAFVPYTAEYIFYRERK